MSIRRVIVDGRYTYETDKEVQIGNTVVLPTPDFLRDVKGPTFNGKITSLESDYTGSCKRIIEVLKS